MHIIAGLFLFISLFLASPGILKAERQIDAGISIGEEGLKGFYLSVGEYYRVPQREVIIIRERGIPAEELPVVFFIAERAHVAPSVIINMRLSRTTWFNIMLHYRLSPEILYVPVRVVHGPPYGKAYGHFKKPRREWKKIVLDDDDVVNLVNLRFTSNHYGIPPERVIQMRTEGRNFVTINDEIKKERTFKSGKEKGNPGKDEKDKGHGDKGHGKGKP
ncbi:MAG: hypothetical protein HZC13_04835 [Nitrospirae bacterium]|nr:hypothetical protein [Nitrospirota bacterium]MBI5096151.1 hypothetical protein [Nitrospirota bacterium]